ncbi:MAG: TIR domain-containing protein [Gammaproteobacteria bacterium]|nr:TIR domain-containing protein [Gammaproteobacteria bacterium]
MPTSTASRAVFLSYASEDAAAAERIAQALAAAGIEIWFDKSELRGGDAWDRRIREQIHDCRLFIPVISANTERRDEGYFRREWTLAADRTRDMAHKRAFLVPVVIDATGERSASVPDKFHDIQWTRLPGGEATAAFVERVQRLLSPEPAPAGAGSTPVSAGAIAQRPATGKPRVGRLKSALWVASAALGVALVYLAADKLWWKRAAHTAASTAVGARSRVAIAAEKSLAVLPFADMSEKHDQEYLCDGLAEELISRLARAADLKVIARTSSFQFKGKAEDVRAIAGKLGVANLVEGSIRRSGARIRINVHLVRAADEAPLWSESYDRVDADTLKMQDEIADAVARSLSVSLRLDSPSTPAMSEAYTLLLRGRQIADQGESESDYRRGLALIDEALRQDPHLGLAWAEASRLRLGLYVDYTESQGRDAIRKAAVEEAKRALELAPDLAEAHLAMARTFMFLDWDWTRAEGEMRRSLELGPNNATVQRNAYFLATILGRWDEALRYVTRASQLDPLSSYNLGNLGSAQVMVWAFPEAEKSYRSALELNPSETGVHSSLAYNLWVQGKRAEAVVENERETDEVSRLSAQAFFYQRLGKKEEANRALHSFIEKYGKTRPAGVAGLLGELGNRDAAFQWWERGVREREPAMVYLLSWVRDPDLPGIGKDPRFKALLRKMNLPDGN